MIGYQTNCDGTRMRAPLHTRALRAAASTRLDMNAQPARRPPPRERKGVVGRIPSAWRRCTMGTNRISCLGIWRIGTRREAMRANRTGDTDWHRPYRVRPRMQLFAAVDAS
jgi:hypothetical protein